MTESSGVRTARSQDEHSHQPAASRRSDSPEPAPLFAKFVAMTGALILGSTTTLVFFRILPRTDILDSMLRTHFAAITGVPMSAIAATVVITMFRVAAGRIEFRAIGFQFRGASGPVVLWVFCFLAFITAIRLLWSTG